MVLTAGGEGRVRDGPAFRLCSISWWPGASRRPHPGQATAAPRHASLAALRASASACSLRLRLASRGRSAHGLRPVRRVFAVRRDAWITAHGVAMNRSAPRSLLSVFRFALDCGDTGIVFRSAAAKDHACIHSHRPLHPSRSTRTPAATEAAASAFLRMDRLFGVASVSSAGTHW